MDHLIRASSSGLIDKTEEGRQSAAALLELKPDFPERGRVLIQHFIKFDEIVDSVIEGLSKAGIEVA